MENECTVDELMGEDQIYYVLCIILHHGTKCL